MRQQLTPVKVHSDQMGHVRRGCLARSRQDIRTDGSRIEGSHKHWNSIQRAQPSGIEVYHGLCHDTVHRRNLRIGISAIEKGETSVQEGEFLTSTYGSHHTRLVSYVAERFNALRSQEKGKVQKALEVRPTLKEVIDDQLFGLVVSNHSLTFGGLLVVKEVLKEEDELLAALEERTEDLDDASLIQQLGIDQTLLNVPATVTTPPAIVRGMKPSLGDVAVGHPN